MSTDRDNVTKGNLFEDDFFMGQDGHGQQEEADGDEDDEETEEEEEEDGGDSVEDENFNRVLNQTGRSGVREESVERDQSICHHNKASQTCFCSENKANTIKSFVPNQRHFVQQAPLADLQEESEDDYEHQEADETNYKNPDVSQQPTPERTMKPVPPQPPNPQDQIRMLRDLLRLERDDSARRQSNNAAMQNYVQQLQRDFLRQQRELLDALEFSQRLKSQNESQIRAVEATLAEKDKHIEQLQKQLASLDEDKLNSQFKATLDKQKQMFNLREQQFQTQLKQLEEQLTNEQNSSASVLSQCQTRLGDQLKAHERELAAARSCSDELQIQLNQLVNEPQNLVIKTLREECAQLRGQLEGSQTIHCEFKSKYEQLERKLENLLAEQEQLETVKFISLRKTSSSSKQRNGSSWRLKCLGLPPAIV